MAKFINPYTDFGFKKLFGEEAFQTAELANLSPEQREKYEESLIYYRDLKSVLETAIEERETEIILNAIRKGLDDNFIAELTNLPIEQIQQIRKQMK
ncbi:hypothetical protein [Raineya sp.]|jgi:hypothetical protein